MSEHDIDIAEIGTVFVRVDDREASHYLYPGHQCTGLVQVEPITVICKHNTPDALTGSVFLSPVDYERVPEGTYALVRLGGTDHE